LTGSKNRVSTKAVLLRDNADIRVDGVFQASTVFSCPECRHYILALNLAHKSIRKISFQVPADLRKTGAIFNRGQQKQAGLLCVLRADAPTSRHCQRVIKNLSASGRLDDHYRHLNLLLPVEITEG